MHTTVLLFLTIFSFCNTATSYNILIIVPGLSNSQILFNYRLGDLLGSRGHNVVLYRAQYNPNIGGVKPPKFAKEFHFKAIKNETAMLDLLSHVSTMFDDVNPLRAMPMFFKMFDMFRLGCETQITDVSLMKQLSDMKFDLAIGHMYDSCPLGMIRALKIPTYIWTSSGILTDYMAWYTGTPNPASFVPNMLSSFGDKMSFVERLQNVLGETILQVVYKHMAFDKYTSLFRQHFGSDFPAMTQLAAEAPLLFVNSEELIDFPRPVLHKIVYIGGIDMNMPEPLTDEWKAVMDKANKGVIFVSFGSAMNATKIPEAWKAAFLDAFSRFPDYTFIWKYEADLPNAAKLKNVKLTKWAPQKDLLAHPKMKAFFTHCGFNSILETVNNGVPIVGLPLFGDQLGNLKRVERHGLGVGIRKSQVSGDVIAQAVQSVLTNPLYTNNAKRLAGMLKKKPVKPDQLVVGWVEFLAEFKQLPNLQPASTQLGLIEYFLIDVAAVLTLGATVIIFFIFIITRCVCRRLCGKNEGHKKSKKPKKE